MNLRRDHMLVRAGRVGARAFTLVELLVAVAIVGLLTVGIAQVFSLTGKTVSGGRRLSTLNTLASVIERQLRSDVAAITRDGFLLVRHELVRDPIAPTRGVQLWAADEKPRDRRADELVFFAKGEFQTAREPLSLSRNPRSNVARIYYGHGVRSSLSAFAAPAPQVDDPSSAAMTPKALGERPAAPGQTYPNQFAGDWTLLRHVCVLTQPQAGNQTVEPVAAIPASGPVRQQTWNDSDAQVGLQPAARSVFRALASETISVLPSNSLVRGGFRPLFSSGLVDIATTDLSEIRAFVNGVPLTSALNLLAVPPDVIVPGTNVQQVRLPPEPLMVFSSMSLGDAGAPDLRARDAMQAWMREALPANSDKGERMRSEPVAPNLSGIGLSWESPADPERPYRQADQLMLSASNFVARCSEFIVEWSFGQTEPDPAVLAPAAVGRVLWHGLERDISVSGKVDAAGKPQFDTAIDYRVAPYGQKTDQSGARPNTDLATQVYALNTGALAQRAVSDLLIHGPNVLTRGRIGPLYSYFGFIDPTFDPAPNSRGISGTSPADIELAKSDFLVDVSPPLAGVFPTYDPLDGDRLIEPDSVEWPWPKLLRITMRLFDPADPTAEQTFQFVLPLPERARNAE